MKIKNRAFSLVEILVVIAIIAIMAAISYPVFLRVKWNSYKTVCISNFHQIAINISMYRADNNGAEVGGVADLGLTGDARIFVNHLQCPLHGDALKPFSLPSYSYLCEIPKIGSQADESFRETVNSHRGDTILFLDLNHNSVESFDKKYFSIYALGLTLDGHVATKIGDAFMANWPNWWYSQ